jgi:diacylglycerol kinase family enzyme
MSDNVIIVGNTRAGQASDAPALMRELEGRLAAAGTASTTLPFPEVATEPDWRRRLDELLDAGAKRLFVFGGDGTVRSLATMVLGRDVALGIVALGTANLLARDLGLPLTPADAVAALAEASAVRRIDVARCNGRPFLCAAMFGMTTQLARTREAARGVGAWRILPRLMHKAYWVLRSYPFQRVRLHLDDAPLTLTTRALVVTNNPLAPRPGLYPARPVLDGAELGVYGVTEGPLYDLPRLTDEPDLRHLGRGAAGVPAHLQTRADTDLAAAVHDRAARRRARALRHAARLRPAAAGTAGAGAGRGLSRAGPGHAAHSCTVESKSKSVGIEIEIELPPLIAADDLTLSKGAASASCPSDGAMSRMATREKDISRRDAKAQRRREEEKKRKRSARGTSSNLSSGAPR